MSIRYRVWRAMVLPLGLCLMAGGIAPGFTALVHGQGFAGEPRTAQENANTGDPSTIFLNAHAALTQAAKLEGDGKLRPALAKYRFAASLLEQLSQTNPNWQTLIVRYRARKTTDDIHRLGEKLALLPPEGAVPEASGTSTLMGMRSNRDDDLPEPDPVAPVPAPSIAPVPEGSSPRVERAIPVLPQADAFDRTARKYAKKLAETQNELKAALAALEATKKEKLEAIRKRDAMDYEIAQIKATARASEKRLERFKEDRDDLQKQLDKLEPRYKELVAKNPDGADSRKELRDQIKELKKSLAAADANAQAAAKEHDSLTAKVQEGESANARMKGDLEKAQKQNELTQDAANKIAALEGENAQLNKKLADAETTITRLTEESQKKGEELAGMKKELTTLQDQLVATRDQKDKAETNVTELQQKVDETTNQLSAMKVSGKTSEDFARMTKENELLKGIVMRELKDHARREQARKLISDELAKLDVQSTVLTQQVEELGRTTMLLSDEERALFKDPQVTISDSEDPSSFAVRVTVVKPTGPGGASATPGDAATIDGSVATATESPAAAPMASPDASPAASVTPDGAPAIAAASPAAAATPADATAGGPKVSTSVKPPVAEENVTIARTAMEDFQRRRFVEAEHAYEKLLAREPQNPYLLSSQGAVYSQESKLKQAEIVLKKAVKIAPSDEYSLSTLGIVYYKMQKYDDALTYLTRAVQANPKSATAHNYLGITSSQKGYPEAGLEELSKAIALNPNYADAHFNIAVIYATGQPPAKDQAQEHYKRATELGASPDPALEKLIQK